MAGRIIQEHAVYYNQNWGFDLSFETEVGDELSGCLINLDPKRDGVWAATMDGRFAGSVAIVGTEEGARLRWFLVNPAYHGHGLGLMLLKHAVRFCEERGYDKVHLWTFRGLEAARRLYVGFGFKMTEENKVQQWGREIYEQRYDLDLTSACARELRSIL
jgi:GNAT superfamily N-acetyltransferase